MELIQNSNRTLEIPVSRVVREFEAKIAEHCEAEFVLSVCNATMGIYGVFRSLGLGGQEIITTPLTWSGAISPLLELGCQIKFCDVQPDYLTLDPNKLESHITENTKAVFTADYCGYPAALDKIKTVCERHKVPVIHDAASAFCSTYKGKQSGYFADVCIYSFGSGKLFSIGEGGCITTHSRQMAEKLNYHLKHPKRQAIEEDEVNPFALNTAINPFAAQFGLDSFDNQVKAIRERQLFISECLGSLDATSTVDMAPNYYKVILPVDSVMGMNCNVASIPYGNPIYNSLSANDEGFNCPIAEVALDSHCTIEYGLE